MDIKKIGIFIVAGILLGGGVFLLLKNQSSSTTPQTVATPVSTESPTPEPEKDKEYQDPSGFKFSYPESLTITPQETDDEDVYSSLLLASASHQGEIKIRIFDTKLNSITAYLKELKLNASALNGIDTTLAELPAKKFLVDGKTLTIALDQNIIYHLEVNPQKNTEYWQNPYQKIVDSFAFIEEPTTKTKSAPVEENFVDDSGVEEIVE